MIDFFLMMLLVTSDGWPMLRVFIELHVDVMNCGIGVMNVEPTLSRLGAG